MLPPHIGSGAPGPGGGVRGRGWGLDGDRDDRPGKELDQALVDFLAVDADPRGCGDADADPAALDAHNGDANPAVDDDLFPLAPAQN
jgi:hypothetical protein